MPKSDRYEQTQTTHVVMHAQCQREKEIAVAIEEHDGIRRKNEARYTVDPARKRLESTPNQFNAPME